MNQNKKQQGIVFVVSAPSGTGKTTIINEFLKKHKKDFVLSVSVTTRNKRNGEVDGKDYHFFSREKFKRFIKGKKFLEYADVLGNFYGTLSDTVYGSTKKGKNVIMDIDVQGADSMREKIKNCVTIFITPPSYAELKKRLLKRRTDSVQEIKRRLALAKKELKERKKYDYIIQNKDLKKSVARLETIVTKEKTIQ